MGAEIGALFLSVSFGRNGRQTGGGCAPSDVTGWMGGASGGLRTERQRAERQRNGAVTTSFYTKEMKALK